MAWSWKVEAQLNPADPNAWVDISEWCIPLGTSMTVTRGRADDLSQFEAGTLVLELNNSDGRFTPENTLGAYWPRVTVNRGIRASVDVNGVVTRRFTGHTVAWQPDWDSHHPGRCRLVCADAFERFAQYELPYAAQAVIRAMAPAGYWPLGQGTDLADLSGNAATATPTGTYKQAAEWIKRNWYEEFPAYWGPSLEVGVNNANNVQGAAYVPDSTRYGTPNSAFSVHFRIMELPGSAANYHILGVGNENPAATDQSAMTNAFISARWAIWNDLDVDDNIKFTRGNGDGTQTTWATGLKLDQANVDGTHHGSSFVFVVTPTRFRVYQDGVLRIDDGTVDGTMRMQPLGNLWMGGFAADSTNVVYDDNGLHGRISDVAIWARDITTDPHFNHLLASHHGWKDDTPIGRLERLLDIAGWPAADRALDTGNGLLAPLSGAGNVLNAMREVGTTDAGDVYMTRAGIVKFQSKGGRWTNRRSIVATYGDGAGETPYKDVEYAYDNVDLVNDVEVHTAIDQVAARQDQTSIDTYGRRTQTFEVETYDAASAHHRANYELQTRKDMRLRIGGLDAGLVDSDARANTALALEVIDLIRVWRRPAGGDVLDRRLRVQQIVDQVSNGGYQWQVTFATSDAEEDTAIEPYGTATYDNSRYAWA